MQRREDHKQTKRAKKITYKHINCLIFIQTIFSRLHTVICPVLCFLTSTVGWRLTAINPDKASARWPLWQTDTKTSEQIRKTETRNNSCLRIRHSVVFFGSRRRKSVFWSSFLPLLHSLRSSANTAPPTNSELSYTDYHLKDLMREILLALAGNAPNDSRVCDEDLEDLS